MLNSSDPDSSKQNIVPVDEYCPWQHIVEFSVEALVVLNSDGTIKYFNPAFANLICSSPGQAQNPKIQDFFEQNIPWDTFFEELLPLETLGPFRSHIKRANGSSADVEIHLRRLPHDSEFQGILCNIRDISDIAMRENQLFQQAMHDPLTGLPNRRLLTDRLKQTLASSRRREKFVAILFLDVDCFKNINDTIGHLAGDALLIQIAERLCLTVRESDTVARIGGDEFIIVASDLDSPDCIQKLANRLLDTLRLPFTLHEKKTHITMSIGVYPIPDDTQAPFEHLIQKSDTAMYRAKRNGGNQIIYLNT